MAQIELALCRSYHAADIPPIDPQTLQEIAPDALLASCLQLAPSVHLIRSRWPVVSLVHANSSATGGAPPKMQPEDALIIRPEFDPEIIALPAGGGAFIKALLRGAPLGEALKAATIASGDFNLTEVLGLLLKGGAIIKITEGTAP